MLYLGEPEPSVVVEAYRHFIDPIEDPAMLAEIRPRILVTAGVTVDEILDLTSAGARMTTGLSLEILQSDTSDREAYERCQEVAQVAHQLGRRGILAPAATKMGRTQLTALNAAGAGSRLGTRCGTSSAGSRSSDLSGSVTGATQPVLGVHDAGRRDDRERVAGRFAERTPALHVVGLPAECLPVGIDVWVVAFRGCGRRRRSAPPGCWPGRPADRQIPAALASHGAGGETAPRCSNSHRRSISKPRL